MSVEIYDVWQEIAQILSVQFTVYTFPQFLAITYRYILECHLLLMQFSH